MTPLCADAESGIDDPCEMHDDGVHVCAQPEGHLAIVGDAHQCDCGVTW